jgi:hypothetical protein
MTKARSSTVGRRSVRRRKTQEIAGRKGQQKQKMGRFGGERKGGITMTKGL